MLLKLIYWFSTFYLEFYMMKKMKFSNSLNILHNYILISIFIKFYFKQNRLFINLNNFIVNFRNVKIWKILFKFKSTKLENLKKRKKKIKFQFSIKTIYLIVIIFKIKNYSRNLQSHKITLIIYLVITIDFFILS